MISQDLLDIVRCPLSPSQVRLLLQGDRLVCERCALRFRIKDGFPVLVAEEAELPPGCEGLADLPCQRREEEGRNEPAGAQPPRLARREAEGGRPVDGPQS
jgi:uncharacterized protein YbaR (Trm112 family)